ncbi:efflux transporter outer membrane subunit [Mitsuaria sp. GD03876]|uniref:efflux transporter outer membrane subunit n=1 Tax=Mitsuaria sp. GD03876 TaxID=2975399 RepID=UPI00244BE624|nr:efflux transporter outer membrane subunit [Mitsuaria sp. GD03876]MDH0868191.1 efflux transporter outer membrane subunit [Mitsuaria sp. GD03876]
MKRLNHSILAAALAAVLGGCAMTPPLTRPDSPVPAQYPRHAHEVGDAMAADIGWRSMFDDARLQRLIEIALVNNRDLRLAALNVEAVRAQYDIQKAAELPHVGATATHTRERTSAGGTPMTQTQAGVSVGVTAFELDLFGRVRAQSEAALSRYLASEQGRRSAQIALVGAVAEAYFAERLAQAQLELSERTMEDWRGSLLLVRQLKAAEQTGALELAQAEAQVATSEADREARLREAERRAHALALLIGQALPDDLPEGSSLMAASVITRLPAGLPSQLLTRRPDLLQAELALVAANAEIGAARAALFPRIALTASVGTASSGLKDLFKSGTGVWSFAPQITQPLFNAGQLRTEVRLAELRKSAAVLEYERAVQTAFREVADGLTGQERYARQAEAQSRAVDAASRRASLAELRYRAGVDSRLEVLDAQRQLYAARQAVLDLRREEIGNAIALYKALGGGLEERTLAMR